MPILSTFRKSWDSALQMRDAPPIVLLLKFDLSRLDDVEPVLATGPVTSARHPSSLDQDAADGEDVVRWQRAWVGFLCEIFDDCPVLQNLVFNHPLLGLTLSR